MSFRELRNFTEMMRALGYSRPISVDNFRTPNFELVADALYWLAKKYDPNMTIAEEIDTEDDRIDFLTSICTGLLAKARVKLNAKKLYSGDGHAVKELLKVASILYEASRIDPTAIDEEEDTSLGSSLSTKVKDTKTVRLLATDITDRGAKLYDLLDNELEIKEHRDRAIRFLDAVSTNLESTSEHKYVEKSIEQAIQNLRETIETMKKQSNELEADQNTLSGKIEKKKNDLERSEKRLRSIQTVRPAFMDEYEKLEKDLEYQYSIYCKRFRNLDYLEYELNLYDRFEKERMKEKDRSMQRMQKKLRDEELRILRGEDQNNLDFSIDDSSPVKTKQQEQQQNETSSSSESDDSDEESESQVSIGSNESDLLDEDSGSDLGSDSLSDDSGATDSDDHDF